MSRVQNVKLRQGGLNYFLKLFQGHQRELLDQTLSNLRLRLEGRVFWHINSTAKGGGVAEMLPSMLGYLVDYGIDARWLVISGEGKFFPITKRLHHALHGSSGDGSLLGENERKIYESVIADNAGEILAQVSTEDVVVLHDPQTAGLLPHLKNKVSSIAWRCHIGHDRTNDSVDQGWDFLMPYLNYADAYIFSRESYIPRQLPRERCFLIAPSIDPFTTKNTELDPQTTTGILSRCGLIETLQETAPITVTLADKTTCIVSRKADLTHSGPLLDPDNPLVVQVSRWDDLKDYPGVLQGFVRYCQLRPESKACLMLIGPDVKAVSDDPEGAGVFLKVERLWSDLSEHIRDRIYLVNLPMQDVDENALMVNAIQRHAAVIVQKSLHEGFGLTVTEAMWKGKPIIASAVGGIQDQICNREHGLLLDDPHDIETFALLLAELLDNPKECQALGLRAAARVREDFLVSRHYRDYLEVIEFMDTLKAAMADGEQDEDTAKDVA